MSYQRSYIMTIEKAIGGYSENDVSKKEHSSKVPVKEFSF